MRKLILTLLFAIAISACANVTVGPVDHSCHTDPRRGLGSGCGGGVR